MSKSKLFKEIFFILLGNASVLQYFMFDTIAEKGLIKNPTSGEYYSQMLLITGMFIIVIMALIILNDVLNSQNKYKNENTNSNIDGNNVDDNNTNTISDNH